jgi:hypothetical protein
MFALMIDQMYLHSNLHRSASMMTDTGYGYTPTSYRGENSDSVAHLRGGDTTTTDDTATAVA